MYSDVLHVVFITMFIVVFITMFNSNYLGDNNVAVIFTRTFKSLVFVLVGSCHDYNFLSNC